MFSACASLCDERAVQLGNKLLNQIPSLGLNGTMLVNSAIHMLMKFGEVERAELLFSRIREPESYAYGVMMNGCNINEQPRDCLKLFEQLKQQKIACNASIWFSLVNACTQIGMRSTCQRIMDQIPLEAQQNLQMKTPIVDMWVGIECSVLFS